MVCATATMCLGGILQTCLPLFSRYQINEFPGGSLLRIEPVRKKREDNEFECVAENGVGDQVTATAKLDVYDGKFDFEKL